MNATHFRQIDQYIERFFKPPVTLQDDVMFAEEVVYSLEPSQDFEATKSRKAVRAKETHDIISRLDEPFSATLRRLIIVKGKTPPEVYKKANLDRKLWSKIQNNSFYMPSKKTAVAFALALELDLVETKDLLDRAGFSLSHSQKFDVIIEYFIKNKIYDFFEINDALRHYDQPLL